MLMLDWLVRSHRRESVGASRGPNLGRDNAILSTSVCTNFMLLSISIVVGR